MSQPLSVSVVIPCFNVASFIEGCLDGVLAQTCGIAEVVCVDDGSTDETLEVLERVAAAHPGRIDVVSGPNQGAPTARNTGLARATGTYVQFLDADDVIERDKLAHQLALCAEHTPLPDLVTASFHVVNLDTGETSLEVAAEDPWEGLVLSKLGTTSANLFRREAVLAVDGWDPSLKSSQEYDLMFRLVKAGGRVLHDPEPKATAQRRAGTISSSNPAGTWTRFVEVRRRMLDHLEGVEGTARVRELGRQRLFRAIRNVYRHDPERARALHRAHVPAGFHPDPSWTIGWSYRTAYTFLGFAAAERLADLRQRLTGRRARP